MFDDGIVGVVSLVLNYGPYGPSLGLGIFLWGVITFLCLRIIWGDESPLKTEKSQNRWSLFILATLPFFSFGAILFLLIYRGEAHRRLALLSIVLVIIFPFLFLCEAHVYDRQLKGEQPDPLALYVSNLNIPLVMFKPPEPEVEEVREKLDDDVYMKVTFDAETNTLKTQTNSEAIRRLMEVKRKPDGTTEIINFNAFRVGTTFDDVELPAELLSRVISRPGLFNMQQKIGTLPAVPELGGTEEDLRQRMDFYFQELRNLERRELNGMSRLSLQFLDYILEDGVVTKKEFDAITSIYHMRKNSQSQRMAPIAQFFVK